MASVSKVSILDYFNIVFESENGKIESNCKACGTRIQAKRSVTSNFVTHLKVSSLNVNGCRRKHGDNSSMLTHYRGRNLGGTMRMRSSLFAHIKISYPHRSSRFYWFDNELSLSGSHWPSVTIFVPLSGIAYCSTTQCPF